VLSAVVLTKNEEKNLPDCLNSLKFADEIIVIDDYSSDSTAEIAKSLGAKVVFHHLANDYAQSRNFALSQTSSDWILFVDADERVSPELAREITVVVKKAHCSGYYLPRYDFLWNKQLHFGDPGHFQILRLGQRRSGVWRGRVHETWDIQGSVRHLSHPLFHFPHPDLYDFLQHLDFYSTLRSGELMSRGEHTSLLRIVLLPILKFNYLYFIKLGIFDGTPGLIHALSMSFYTFLTQGKLYLH
jgi:glycosyltransferase involved in cell wall biosynthesis